MQAHALTLDREPVRQVESALRAYLPGLDVRLAQYSPRQALLAGHLMTALQREYGTAGSAAILRQIGVARVRALSDAESIAILQARDVRDLAPRTRLAPAAPAALDWHLTQVHAASAWDLLGGRDAIDWTGIRVGQIDTGYTRHPAYGFPAPWLDVANAETFMPAPPPNAPTDPPPELGHGLDNLDGFNGGHGTKTGSTIAGSADAASFYGVAPKCPLVPVRICNSVGINANQREFEQAVHHLVDVVGVKAINVSLGVFPAISTKALKRAVDHAYARGVIMVCAAGNWVNSVVAPANLRRTLAIGGITASDAPWSGTSHGPEVDLSAPAADMRSAATKRGGTFVYASGGDGTSYATAMVTGAAALWHAAHRAELGAAYREPWQVVEAFRFCARHSARKPAVWNSGALGEGVLDVLALLNTALPSASSLAMEPANA